MRDLATLFKALSDETRLQIMGLLLRHRELCVCDLERSLRITQSKCSRHLRYLAAAGLVDDRREGAWVYYKLRALPGTPPGAVVELLGRLIDPTRLQEPLARLDAWLARCCPPVQGAPPTDRGEDDVREA